MTTSTLVREVDNQHGRTCLLSELRHQQYPSRQKRIGFELQKVAMVTKRIVVQARRWSWFIRPYSSQVGCTEKRGVYLSPSFTPGSFSKALLTSLARHGIKACTIVRNGSQKGTSESPEGFLSTSQRERDTLAIGLDPAKD